MPSLIVDVFSGPAVRTHELEQSSSQEPSGLRTPIQEYASKREEIKIANSRTKIESYREIESNKKEGPDKSGREK